MEQQPLATLQKLLAETAVNEVEKDQRVYTSSSVYGSSRYHLLDKVHDGVQIEQMDIDEKWSRRINFCLDELPFVLKTLVTWYLEAIQPPDASDLDDHPF